MAIASVIVTERQLACVCVCETLALKSSDMCEDGSAYAFCCMRPCHRHVIRDAAMAASLSVQLSPTSMLLLLPPMHKVNLICFKV